MKISKIRVAFAGLFGGVSGIVKYLLEIFNTQILSKITDKETGAMYLKDVEACVTCVDSISQNHASQMSEAKRAALAELLDALREIADALEDFYINETELDIIIEEVKQAIEAFKKAK